MEKKNTYTDVTKACIKRYREKNKEEINKKNREYYHKKMQDPEYKLKLREQANNRYKNKKNKKNKENKENKK